MFWVCVFWTGEVACLNHMGIQMDDVSFDYARVCQGLQKSEDVAGHLSFGRPGCLCAW